MEHRGWSNSSVGREFSLYTVDLTSIHTILHGPPDLLGVILDSRGRSNSWALPDMAPKPKTEKWTPEWSINLDKWNLTTYSALISLSNQQYVAQSIHFSGHTFLGRVVAAPVKFKGFIFGSLLRCDPWWCMGGQASAGSNQGPSYARQISSLLYILYVLHVLSLIYIYPFTSRMLQSPGFLHGSYSSSQGSSMIAQLLILEGPMALSLNFHFSLTLITPLMTVSFPGFMFMAVSRFMTPQLQSLTQTSLLNSSLRDCCQLDITTVWVAQPRDVTFFPVLGSRSLRLVYCQTCFCAWLLDHSFLVLFLVWDHIWWCLGLCLDLHYWITSSGTQRTIISSPKQNKTKQRNVNQAQRNRK